MPDLAGLRVQRTGALDGALTVTPVDDGLPEDPETVVLELMSP